MFNFFKKKESQTKDVIVPELTTEQKDMLTMDLQQLKLKIEEIDPEDKACHVELAKLYEQSGLIQEQLGCIDDAMTSLEKSLAFKLTIGDGYKKLMSLYNLKRSEAAYSKDDSGIEKYLDKMEEMRQIAKKLTISG